METSLSENIRRFRKTRSLTQQQLADALGVTVGAVYKWEAKLSAPDLSLLMELADLFDTSVDVLLGYELRSNKPADTAARLKEYLHRRDRAGLTEAEKTLTRYPNCFEVVYESAMLYYNFGFMCRDRELLRRSIELLDRAIPLLGQNTDPEISELSIHIDMANALSSMGEDEKAVELLKKDDPRGINDDMIGLYLAGALDRPQEARDYLSSSLVRTLATLVRITLGYENVFFKQGDFISGRDILRLVLDFLEGFRDKGRSYLLDKPCVSLCVSLACAELMTGEEERARAALRRAKDMAERFDSAPDYSAGSLRFISAGKKLTAFDDLGETARDSLIKTVGDMGSDALTKLWAEIDGQ